MQLRGCKTLTPQFGLFMLIKLLQTKHHLSAEGYAFPSQCYHVMTFKLSDLERVVTPGCGCLDCLLTV